jgi:hypothetical protein
MMPRPLFAFTSHDLVSVVYWTGEFRHGQPVATRDLRRAALFDAAWKAYRAAERHPEWRSGDWECRRVNLAGPPSASRAG